MFILNVLIAYFVYLSGLCVLSLESQNFKPAASAKRSSFYISAISAALFGGFGIWINFKSLNYILPSDNTMVCVFTKLTVSVIFQSIEDKRKPTWLTISSIILGIIGTAVICNPKTFLDGNFFQSDTLKGVLLAAACGTSLIFMHVSMRKFGEITPSWTYLWFSVGILGFGLASYPYWQRLILRKLK